jgi:hypothetical protein
VNSEHVHNLGIEDPLSVQRMTAPSMGQETEQKPERPFVGFRRVNENCHRRGFKELHKWKCFRNRWNLMANEIKIAEIKTYINAAVQRRRTRCRPLQPFLNWPSLR